MDFQAPQTAPRPAGAEPPRRDRQTGRMLSSKAKYAVLAMAMLAERFASGDWVSTAEIAVRERISRKFLEAIVVELRDHGLVDSRRGSHGGHRLSRDPARISIAEIIRGMDGPLALTPCASVTRFRPCTDCVDIETCRLQHLMKEARDAVAAVLENRFLSDIIKQPFGEGGSSSRPIT